MYSSRSRSAPAPFYETVKQDICKKIAGGVWQPHDRIPSEAELVAQYGFSRMTINRALRECGYCRGLPDAGLQSDHAARLFVADRAANGRGTYCGGGARHGARVRVVNYQRA